MTDHRFGTVVVLGAGTMGAGIAQVAAQAGSRVLLQDIKQEFVDKGMQRIRDSLAVGVSKQKVTQDLADATLARLSGTTDRVAAAKHADLVIEAVPEILDLKNTIFRELAANCRPDCVLATNTSSLSLQKVFSGVHVPERCVGMHWFNPPPIMKLLEIVRTSTTSQDTIDAVMAYAAQCGKEPILVKDSPGFASSRLGVCLGLEAIRMVEAGVASPEDIDKAMKGMLAPEFEEVVTGEAEVREIFRAPKVGAIAGCFVRSGVITRGSKVRFLRDGTIIWKGAISSLRRFKDDVREVREGFECGIGVGKGADLQVGDVIQVFEMREKKRA